MSLTAKFITLEGIEGCGKSVQSRLLEEEFLRRKLPCLRTRQPGGTPFGKEVRQVLLRRRGARRTPMAELLLYLADRRQSLTEVIEPALAAGKHVICDRYHDATRVYQGFARGIGWETVDRLSEILEIRVPDLTLVLDIDLETGLRRARQRHVASQEEEWSRFEFEALEFHRKVQEGYRLLRDREPERIRFVDGSGTPEQVNQRIRQEVAALGLSRELNEASEG